jgi:hypothetical protein
MKSKKLFIMKRNTRAEINTKSVIKGKRDDVHNKASLRCLFLSCFCFACGSESSRSYDDPDVSSSSSSVFNLN